MTRRWTHAPTSDDVPIAPSEEDCCFDADTVQEFYEQILHVGSLVSIKKDGSAVTGFCDLVIYNDSQVNVGYLYKVSI